MNSELTSCIKCVDGSKNFVKNGKTKAGNQRYKCKNCNTTRVSNYIYKAYSTSINASIILLTKEGLGIRSTSRVLKISTTTVLKRIIKIAATIHNPIISKGKTYEVDEMCTFVKRKNKFTWIVYALDKSTRKVVCYNTGNRTNKTLNHVLKSLTLSNAHQIYTDGLKNYRYLIKPGTHVTIRFGTNYIERNNLNLRTHLKRLNRRTICFSKSILILNAILRIYFWG